MFKFKSKVEPALAEVLEEFLNEQKIFNKVIKGEMTLAKFNDEKASFRSPGMLQKLLNKIER
jgi:signal recognition particle GTPase